MLSKFEIIIFFLTDNRPNLIVDESMYNQEELHNLTAALSREKADMTMSEDRFSEEKENFKLQLIQSIDDISCPEELEAAKKIIASIQPTIMALRNSQKELTLKINKNVPHNKNICHQRRLFQTKKIKSKQKNQFVKPNSQEANNIAFDLLHTVIE